MDRVLVTGANGHLGRRLLKELTAPTRALVRSEAAASTLADHGDVGIVDYGDGVRLRDACVGCASVVHLVGIIKESARATYAAAHEESTRNLLRAATDAGVGRIVYLSILGADVDSPNPCLASKARAETILLQSAIPSLVIRVPMVLGESDYASVALLAKARRRVAFEFRASSLEQPIYAGNVVDAIRGGLAADGPTGILELAGLRSLSRGELIAVASGVGTRIVSLPLGLGYALAWMLERVSDNPPLTRAMLGVLDHDDDIDPQPGAEALGIRLTGLAETLARVAAA
ncbi:MAG: NAD(P)H-binding protein [Pseudomonadales bacterium]|nr:NAD(P)H-binding protein [Pseudomonadales bacterium]